MKYKFISGFGLFVLNQMLSGMVSLSLILGVYHDSPASESRQIQVNGGQDVSKTLLHIALQEGFTNDSVVIKVNGKEVFKKSGVNTRYQIGFADSAEAHIDIGTAEVEVILPLKGLKKSVELQIPGPTYLAVILTPEGNIDFRVSKEPFKYM